MKLGLILFSAFLSVSILAQTKQHNLMPVPAHLSFDTGRLLLDSTFTFAVKGESDARLQAAIVRAKVRLQERTGYDLQFSEAAAAKLIIQRQGPGKLIPALDEDESYTLNISDSQALLSANTTVGVIRGLETLLQLLASDKSGYYFPAVRITDQPRFVWRGLMLDVGRHFLPLEVVKRNLDAMAAVKFNVLHWHLTEDQGFRVESKKYPKLHEMGSDGQYYTQEQIKEVIAYAKERGIRVVPEFDIPGHTTAWLVGYPELGSGPGPYQIERGWGVFKPALNPTNEEVYTVLDGFLGEMAALFPDAYLHIGGDEVEGHQWKENTQIQEWMKKNNIADNNALQAYFNRRVADILKKHGKIMVGWDEILHPDLPKNIVVHSWRGIASLAESAKKGYAGILSNGYYINFEQPAAAVYVVDPIPAYTTLTAEQQTKILGGEATMWAEYISAATADSRIWPRAAAVAERFWSPREVNNVDDMYRRLAVINLQLEELGLQHLKQQDAMLRLLTQSENIAALKSLLELVEPVKFLGRYKLRKYTQQTPMTRLVDAARPDSAVARNFNKQVEVFLADAPNFGINREQLNRTLDDWAKISQSLPPMLERSPVLHEAQPLAVGLNDLSRLGREALSLLASHSSPPADWQVAKLKMLDQLATPKAEVEFVVLQGIRQLVVAAAEQEQLKSLAPADWVKKIQELAAPKKGRRQ